MVTCCWNDDEQLEMHMMLWEIGTEWRISGSMEHHKWKGDQLRMPNSSFANHLWIFHCFILHRASVPWLREDAHDMASGFQAGQACTGIPKTSQYSKKMQGGWISSGRRRAKRKPVALFVDDWEDIERVQQKISFFSSLEWDFFHFFFLPSLS